MPEIYKTRTPSQIKQRTVASPSSDERNAINSVVTKFWDFFKAKHV
jgi:hypothetical protein